MIDPIADLLVRIRNASLAGKRNVTLPYSKLKKSILDIMKREGFIDELEITEDEGKKNIAFTISQSKSPSHLAQVSKQGRKMYVKRKDIKIPLRGLGLVILSTPHGVITGREAIKKGIGGELICEIW